MNLKISNHPLIQHKLTRLREVDTSIVEFRSLLDEISLLHAYEVTSDLPIESREIRTPICKTQCPSLINDQFAIITILRAGLGPLNSLLHLLPAAKVGHIGLYREENAENIVEYYSNLPSDISNNSNSNIKTNCILIDPMLATGKSAVVAINKIKSLNPYHLKFMCLIAAPEGIEYVHQFHPDITIYAACVDEKLNSHKYIVPGLGDAGDRYFGT